MAPKILYGNFEADVAQSNFAQVFQPGSAPAAPMGIVII
jgi:hypothetical protein